MIETRKGKLPEIMGGTMYILVIYVILFFVFLAMPKALKFVVMVANFCIPDPVPFIDEAVMVLGFLASFNKD